MHVGKLRSDSEVRIFKRKIASANVADSLSNLHLQQKDSSEMHAGNHDDHSERKQLYISNGECKNVTAVIVLMLVHFHRF